MKHLKIINEEFKFCSFLCRKIEFASLLETLRGA